MSVLDKVVASITPPESADDRANARQSAENAAEPGDWLSLVLDQHRRIESLFAEAARGTSADARLSAFKELATVLNGHSLAEEIVLYPALEQHGEKGGAAMAYEEQSMTKVQMARLEQIDPMSQDWNDKLEHIQGAVLHHVYEEEGTWFPRLKQDVLQDDQRMLRSRFAEEYSRYTGETIGDDRPAMPQMSGGGALGSGGINPVDAGTSAVGNTG